MFSILKGHEGYHKNREVDAWEFIPSDNWIFAKVFRRNAKGEPVAAPAMLPSQFNLFKEEDPSNLEEALILVKELSSNPSLLAVRGKLRPDVLPSFKRNGNNFNTELKSHIIAMDMDSIPLPEGIGLDLIKWGEYVLSLFNKLEPDIFPNDGGFIVHASSSAGIKPGVRMHMLVESQVELSQGQIKAFFSDFNARSRVAYGFDLVDLAFYSATQPHFFADPKFYDGVDDPFVNKSRVEYKVGTTCKFPAGMPSYTQRRADISKVDFSIFNMVAGRVDEVKSVESAIKGLEDAQDSVYLRVLPKIFHKAWQEGYSMAKLEERVTPLLQKYVAEHGSSRTVQQYMQNAKTEALRAFLGESMRAVPNTVEGVNVELRHGDSSETDQYLKLKALPPKGSVSFIKASLGTGKTTAVVNWLKDGLVEGRFLAITNTRTLVASNASKFEAGQYNISTDIMNFCADSNGRLSTTLHSLHKLDHIADEIKFLFIDECDAVMNDLLFSTIVRKQSEVIDVLQTIMERADYIVLSDGDISEETISAYSSLIGYTKPIVAYNHQRRMLHNATALEYCSVDSIWSRLQTELKLGNKSILVSDCGPDILNEMGMLLRGTTGKVIKEIHASSTLDEDIMDILDHTNDALERQGVVGLLCSPSVTGGVDFNYFDNVFVITKQANQTPNLRFQALRRDRGARKIFYYTSPNTKGFKTGSSQYIKSSCWTEHSRWLYAKRRENESRNFPNTFRYYLIDQGCPITVVSTKLGVESEDDYTDKYLAQKVEAVLASSINTFTPRHNDAYQIKLDIMKYYHIEKFEEVTEEVVVSFIRENPPEKASFFHKIYKDFWHSIKKCTPKSLSPFREAIKNKAREFFIATGCSASPALVKRYLIQAGIADIEDCSRAIDWYKTYCVGNNISIPTEFLTEEELMNKNDSIMELT